MSRKRGSDLVWGVGELAVQEGSDSWVPPGVTVYLCSICVTKTSSWSHLEKPRPSPE